MIRTRTIGTIILTASLAIAECVSYSRPAMADMSNLTRAGSAAIVSMGALSAEYVDMPFPANGVVFYPPFDGYLYTNASSTSDWKYYYIYWLLEDGTVLCNHGINGSATNSAAFLLPISKDIKMRIDCTMQNKLTFRFIKAKGGA